MKPLLITGATGCIGSHLLHELAGTRPLHLLVRGKQGVSSHRRIERQFPAKVFEAFRRKGTRLFDGDITRAALGLNGRERRKLGDGLSGIVHLAAHTSFGETEEGEHDRVNVMGTRRVAELAAEIGCPLFFVSTAYICGSNEGIFFEDSFDTGQSFRNSYESSKWKAEALVREMAAAKKFPLCILRPGIILPDRPVEGASAGPGPLVYLQYLANLEGRNSSGERNIRIEGDETALLNLVPASFVVRVLLAAMEAPPSRQVTYHVTADRSFTVGEVAEVGNGMLEGIRVVIRPSEEMSDLDSYERLLARHCHMYRPYRFLHTTFDRSHLVSDFGEKISRDGADAGWLRRVFAGHLEDWRERKDTGTPCGNSREVLDYFNRFLSDKFGENLVPGLRSLSVDFTVRVKGTGMYRFEVREGCLLGVAPVETHSPGIHYEVDTAGFSEVVAGKTKPSELFFQGRIRISGDLYKAVSTAVALEEFFQLYPYTGISE